ncbi:MAG: FGGY family carbohydrate kinase, partial [Pseudomonadota bacterium]
MRVLGIDIGTSGVKAVVAEAGDRVIAEEGVAIAVSTPHPGWSEQSPDLWCNALGEALDRLAASGALESVAGLGLSGQMLGAVLIDDAGKPVRDAILWNDQRSLLECAALLDKVPDIGMRTNCAPDPGITAPKLMWLAAHEPDTLSRATMLLLPKDYVRLWLTGEIATEPSDASG